ncbi:MAG: M48 family peptidase [Acidobacteria bacterium]|nr:M48 family peptidase [Acidobacteriota bacterium]
MQGNLSAATGIACAATGVAPTAESLIAGVFRQLRPRTPIPEIRVEFRDFAGITSTVEWKGGVLRMQISDVLAQAPADVIEALGFILMGKMLKKPVAARFRDRYRRYLNRRDVVEAAEKTRRSRGRKQLQPAQGRHFDLKGLFEELNFRYFHGLMSRPELGWTPRESRTILGHYDPAHHAIVISRTLDRADVPKEVVAYVLYHEMLHLRYPVKRAAGRRCVHTEEFRKAEEMFEGFKGAERWIKRVFGGRDQ